MKKLNLFVILLIAATVAKGQSPADSTTTKFNNALDENKMVFTQPDGTTSIPIVKNMQMHYEFAVKLNDKPVEIRYSISSLASRVAAYQKFLKDKPPGTVMINPNSQPEAFAFTVAINVGGGVMDPKIGFNAFPPQNVKAEFGADKGGTWIIPIKNSSFGTDYKFCIMTSLHKDDIADAYIMYLGNSREELVDAFNKGGMPLFYALKFKQ
jgi:hypothetical protein